MGFFGVFYCQDSIKSSLKSSAILHFRNPKLTISPIKPRTCGALLGLLNFNFSPPPNQKELPTALDKVAAANAVPKLSLQMQRQSCRCKCSAKVVAPNAVPKCRSGRCKCSVKVVAANAVPKLSLQSCRCECSAKVIAANAVPKLSLQMQ